MRERGKEEKKICRLILLSVVFFRRRKNWSLLIELIRIACSVSPPCRGDFGGALGEGFLEPIQSPILLCCH
jgi:hypothetical protein